MGLTFSHWKEARETIKSLIDTENPLLRDDVKLKSNSIVPRISATMHLPATIGDYTDFYSSIHHATNVGIMFRYDILPRDTLKNMSYYTFLFYHQLSISFDHLNIILSEEKKMHLCPTGSTFLSDIMDAQVR